MEVAALSPALAREMVDAFRALQRSGVLALTRGDRSSQQFVDGVYVVNDSGEAIPPFACMQATGVQEIGGQNYVVVDKPVDRTGAAGVLLWNSPSGIETDGLGKAYVGPQLKCLVNTGSTTTCRTRFAPTIGEWYLSEFDSGIVQCVGPDDVADDIIRAFLVPWKTVIGNTTGATARSGTTLGTGSATIQKISDAGVLSSASITVDYWNLAASALSSGYVILSMEEESGHFVCIWDDCA
jgi:hypothetical protein